MQHEFDPLEYARRSLEQESAPASDLVPLLPAAPEVKPEPEAEPQEADGELESEFDELPTSPVEGGPGDESELSLETPADRQGSDESLPLSVPEQSQGREDFEPLVPVPGGTDSDAGREDGFSDLTDGVFQEIPQAEPGLGIEGQSDFKGREEVWSVNPPESFRQESQTQEQFDETSLRDFLHEQATEDQPEIPTQDFGPDAPESELSFSELESLNQGESEVPGEILLPDSTQESVLPVPVDSTRDSTPEPPESPIETPFVRESPPVSWDAAFPPVPSIEESMSEMEKLSSREIDSRRQELDQQSHQEMITREIVERESVMRNMGGV